MGPRPDALRRPLKALGHVGHAAQPWPNPDALCGPALQAKLLQQVCLLFYGDARI
jgi:hypothetical protein